MMASKPEDVYGTVFIGSGSFPNKEPIVIPPAVDTLSKFHPIGWYAVIRKRKHWWMPWKSSVPVMGKFND
jgi:hypothetical protein